MLNKYVYRSRISEKQFRDIVKYFAVDLEADQVAKITGLSRNTINKYFKAMRVRNGLADIGYGKHFRVHYGENEFVRGLVKHTFYLHLKECEFRFNHRGEDLYRLLCKSL